MNATTDLDRVLGEWLGDGPTRAPDHPVEAAIEHARSHPRRRDPFAFLRPDPMAPRSRGLGARPVMLLAVLGLLLAAVVAVGVGSQPQRVVVGPSPTSVPSGEPSAGPSTASPQPSLGIVQLIDDLDTGATVVIDDASGSVISAVSPDLGTPGPDPNAPIPASGVLVQNQDATTLRLTWGGGGCPTAYRLAIDSGGRSMTVTGAPCGGDAIGVTRVLLLEFAAPVDAASITARLVE
jgi:hypothetical protein